MSQIPEAKIEITVLITCYNESEFICKTIDTVSGSLIESGRSHEIIIIDDLSTDDSVKKIKQHLKLNPNPYIPCVWQYLDVRRNPVECG